MYNVNFKPELELRLQRLSKILREAGVDACLLADNANIYYLSDRVFRGYIFVTSGGLLKYFVIKPVGLNGNDVIYVRKPEQIPEELDKLGIPVPATVGLELNDLSYSDIIRLQKLFPTARFSNASELLKRSRMVKTDREIELIREDGIKQAAVYKQIPHLYEEGMTDVEFQIAIESVLRKEGSLGFYRTSGSLMEINLGSVLNGENADTPTPYDFAVGGGGVDSSLPVGADGRTMLPGTTVMVDMNGNFNGYQSDMTRVWRIGEIPAKALSAHNASVRILRELENLGRPGIPVSQLYERALDIVKEAQLEEYFMGHKQKAAFIGHGVGIQLNELPVVTHRSKDILEANMVIALEPKFVIPEVGAVGVENTYVVTPDGLKTLTIFPEDIADLM